MVMGRAGIGGLQRNARPRLAVFSVKIPLTTNRLFGVVNEHFVTHPHMAVKRFHQPLGAACKKLGSLVPLGVKMRAADHLGGN